jgi:hypothetical protein
MSTECVSAVGESAGSASSGGRFEAPASPASRTRPVATARRALGCSTARAPQQCAARRAAPTTARREPSIPVFRYGYERRRHRVDGVLTPNHRPSRKHRRQDVLIPTLPVADLIPWYRRRSTAFIRQRACWCSLPAYRPPPGSNTLERTRVRCDSFKDSDCRPPPNARGFFQYS